MKVQFKKDTRNPGNVSPTIAHLLKKKAIKRVGEGEYVLMSKAASPKKAEPKTNGAAVATTAEA
jgi:fatty acid-binding protein DegV